MAGSDYAMWDERHISSWRFSRFSLTQYTFHSLLFAMGAPGSENDAWKWFSLSLAFDSSGPFIWWYIFLLEWQVGILCLTGRTLIRHQGFAYFDLWPLHSHKYILYGREWPQVCLGAKSITTCQKAIYLYHETERIWKCREMRSQHAAKV